MGQDPLEREREEVFCLYCARGYDPETAADRAGWPPQELPRRAAALLGLGRVRRRIRQLREELLAAPAIQLARAGLERLALEEVDGEALRLLDGQEVHGGLFHVAEVRRPKGGGVEVRFHDRLRALELLAGLPDGRDGPAGLLEALNRSAGGLGEVGDG